MKRIGILFVLLLILSTTVLAAAPKTLNFQGRLVEQDGNPVVGQQNITFDLFNVESGGTSSWNETINGVALDSVGVFNVILGISTSLNTVDFNQPLWVQVTYAGQIFSPRQQMTSVPYSFYAVTADAIADNGIGSVPVGTVLPFAGALTPTNYLSCEGQAVSRTTYAKLFSVIGTMYGPGDGSSTFNLPDYRGQFLRGWANGQTTDPDRLSRTNRGDGTVGDVVGSKQSYDLQSHAHSQGAVQAGDMNAGGTATYRAFYTNTGSTGGNETRPRNIYVMYIIRAK